MAINGPEDKLDQTATTQINPIMAAKQLLRTNPQSATKLLAIHSTAMMVITDIMFMDSKLVLSCRNHKARTNLSEEVTQCMMRQLDRRRGRVIMLSDNKMKGFEGKIMMNNLRSGPRLHA